MTATKVWYLHCDDRACERNEEATAGEGSFSQRQPNTLEAYRAQAKRNGWTRVDNFDYCPDCSERRSATAGEEVKP